MKSETTRITFTDNAGHHLTVSQGENCIVISQGDESFVVGVGFFNNFVAGARRVMKASIKDVRPKESAVSQVEHPYNGLNHSMDCNIDLSKLKHGPLLIADPGCEGCENPINIEN